MYLQYNTSSNRQLKKLNSEMSFCEKANSHFLKKVESKMQILTSMFPECFNNKLTIKLETHHC